MKEIKKAVTDDFDGMKISDYLRRSMELSVTLIKKVKFGGVFINGINVHMRAIVHTGDTVIVRLPEAKSENIRPTAIPLNIIYEDDYLIAVNKPSGMPTHPSKGNSLPTLAEGIMAAKEMFVEQGRHDARQGSLTYSATVFPALAAAALRMDSAKDHETEQTVADLWYSGYMDGYNGQI